MMKSDIISYIIPIISLLISLISIIIQRISINKRRKNLSKKEYNVHIREFQTHNNSIDLATSKIVNISSLNCDKSLLEFTNNYIMILYRFINNLYSTTDFSISVLLLDSKNNLLKKYTELDNKTALPVLNKSNNYKVEDNSLYRDIINKKYNYIFITESAENYLSYDEYSNKNIVSTFISYPISNNTDDILGFINICSKDVFNDDKSNKLIIDALSETASDIYKLNKDNKLIEQFNIPS